MDDILTLFPAGHDLEREGPGSVSGPCPFCGDGGKPHTGPERSNRFVVWPGDAGRGNVRGRYQCRKCGAKGDALAFLMQSQGMGYREAARAVGLDVSTYTPNANRATSKPVGYTPKPAAPAPCRRWQETAARIVKQARAGLGCPDAVAELGRRFLTVEQAQAMGLGWLAREIWLLPSKDLGLEPEYKADGTAEKKTCMPAGLVIPVLNQAGELVAVEVRRKRGTESTWGKYAFLRGGGGHYMAGARGLPVVVAESKLDCMRLHHVCGVGVLALPASHRPTDTEYDFLQAAACVVVSLDNDGAGKKARAWWLDGKFPRARAAMGTGAVKNFGDLPDADLWAWIRAEIETAAGKKAPTLPSTEKRGTANAIQSAPVWPGVHMGGNPCCEWLPTIERECLGGAKFNDWRGYGIPSTGVPLSLQGVASCGWRVFVAQDGALQLRAGVGRTGGQLRDVCERWLAENTDTIKREIAQWAAYERALSCK